MVRRGTNGTSPFLRICVSFCCGASAVTQRHTGELAATPWIGAVEGPTDDGGGGPHAWSDGLISHLLCSFRCFERKRHKGMRDGATTTAKR